MLSRHPLAIASCVCFLCGHAEAWAKASDVANCVEHYYSAYHFTKPDVGALYQVEQYCYNSEVAGIVVEEEETRKDNFNFQRSENVALLVMVICITLSGVALAGLQLLASFKLASQGRSDFTAVGEVSLRPDAVVVKSSVVGVVILAISFAFFMVFVIDVYTLRDDAASKPQAVQMPPSSGYLGPSQAPSQAPVVNLHPVNAPLLPKPPMRP